jgi:hypothetical protein
MKIFIFWLILVVLWNYGYPQATPLAGRVGINFIVCI